jgi:hypothetical protein
MIDTCAFLIQMKENLNAEINYLRTLNLQFVEQQAKGVPHIACYVYAVT